ncbi:MAG: patatin-like phospholipase family protein [Candidatus Jettenia sp.]|uniref:Patatin n=1 Tax=Candidatus Jettenia caeni TaxID=247490 RepID=I3IMT6_9BACT|nr:patatin-like phospholipase family protein [Candidatus Jettenia sp. AMX1]MBC6928712.1 patatin-like phospholipase family protein [Candidatus Jettenia sp.]WKZ14784.1 MAG: patatin-like phospholipase family protein [Candidatus Jettenia caeni]KAA0250687.1 MAG: patatin-like phospholipase family protein [Candidatus Jettenia sp. AMX1]MCE7880024.1 patatin-like phospholipase family protein [Candidatus Jettenia sp. AMX1]MCQ3926806.1 patatin-like phospholipase family protein [Candidatus Jettenia sp.]
MKKGLHLFLLWVGILTAFFLVSGCVHYPVNKPLTKIDPDSGYRGKFMGTPGNSHEMALFLTFSGGGTRASALAYGVLEELRKTEVTLHGQRRRLLDEVDGIAGVSGGSFTAAYYGLFGDRIFEDFEQKFLKKNVQGALVRRMLLRPDNWVLLSSPFFDRSDLAGEYYNKHIFDEKTFADLAARKGPMIHINATDMVTGIRLAFHQDAFDAICSDISSFPVARAVAASSAVPILLTPITIRNYSNNCGYTLPEQMDRVLKEQDTSSRQFHLVSNIRPYLDSEKRKYIHLVDGGVSDNLGLRAALDRILALGSFWDSVKYLGLENIHKVVFIVVNAETTVDNKLSLLGQPPPFSAMLKSYSSVSITRYNYETVMLLRESFHKWTEEVQKNRCGDGPIITESGGCGDIKFYLVEVRFDMLKDDTEREYLKGLPTSFKLSAEQVDHLREVAHRILTESKDFQQLLAELQ